MTISITQKIIVLHEMNIHATELLFLHYRKSVFVTDGNVLLHRGTAWAEQLHVIERLADVYFFEHREILLSLLSALENCT
jgi:hypothetical protein